MYQVFNTECRASREAVQCSTQHSRRVIRKGTASSLVTMHNKIQEQTTPRAFSSVEWGTLGLCEAAHVGPLLVQQREPRSEGEGEGPEAERALRGVVPGPCPPV